jgi:hypothetical protein
LKGVDLLGNDKDVFSARGSVEKSWPQKSPRLASLMFDSLKTPSTEVDERFQGLINANLTDRAEEQLVNVITLTQPVPYMTGLSFGKYLREVAGRMLHDNVMPNYNKPSSFAVSKMIYRLSFNSFYSCVLEMALGHAG